jgi:sortase A
MINKNNETISEQDLVQLFSEKKPRFTWAGFFGFLNKIFLLLLLTIIVYGGINFNAFKIKLSFWYKNDIQGETVVDQSAKKIISTQTTPEEKKESLPEVAENTVFIPSINVTAPIIWRVNNTSSEVASALEKGVIQIKGTAMPGERGNIYLTGHSSNYVWAKGDYNNIFALLGNLVAGDVAYIKFSNTTYVYKIYDQKVVAPTDLSIMAPSEDSRLSLVTCWPVGTSLKRIVLLAKQIYPDPANNPPQRDRMDLQNLPSGR